MDAALTSLFGAAVGGALFVFSVLLGVIFWVIKERKKDDEISREASLKRRGRQRGIGTRGRERGVRGEEEYLMLNFDKNNIMNC